MNLSVVLDLSISLILIYLILSLVASEIQEIITTVLQWRSKHLIEAIANLFREDKVPLFTKDKDGKFTYESQTYLTQKLYEHCLIKGLNQKPIKRLRFFNFLTGKSIGPSYIPAPIFAESLLDILNDIYKTYQKKEIPSDKVQDKSQIDDGVKTGDQVQDKSQIDDGVKTGDQVQDKSQIDDGDKTDDQVQEMSQIDDVVKALNFAQQKNSINLSQDLIDSLSVIVRRVQRNIQKDVSELQQFQKEVEGWFNTSMERASGVYKRNAKAVTLMIAFVLAIAINADTIYIVDALSKDQTLRATINQLSEQVVNSDPQALSCLDNAENTADKNKCLEKIKVKIDSTFDNLSPLPLGWDFSSPRIQQLITLKGAFLALLGWFISAIAISMGSPFWFELLNRVVNVRNSGIKPQKNQEVK